MLIFKIADGESWRAALTEGRYGGSADDIRDGFIHFSTAEQTRATAHKHFTGCTGLIIAAIESAALGPALKWEASRGGGLFPHLYAALPMETVVWWRPLPLDAAGVHIMPDEVV